MSKLTSITDNKILELLNVLFNSVDFSKAIIKRDLEEDSITITFEENIFNKIVKTGSSIKLTKRSISSNLVSTVEDMYNTYEKWLVANHRHPLQDDNPFIHYVTMQSQEISPIKSALPIYKNACPDSIYEETFNWDALCDSFSKVDDEMCKECWESFNKEKDKNNGK